jgi:hypothetical protein
MNRTRLIADLALPGKALVFPAVAASANAPAINTAARVDPVLVLGWLVSRRTRKSPG